jgi:hypothetical protein
VSQQINLFNPIFLKQKKYFSARTMAQSLGLILLGVALVAVYANYQLFKLRTESVSAAMQLNVAQSQLAKLNATLEPRQKSKTLDNEILRSEAQMQNLRQILETLNKGEFGNTKGYSDYLRAYSRQIVAGVWLTGISITGAGNEIGITGRATKPELVPNYINRLKSEVIMQGKTFSTLEMRVPQVDDNSSNSPTGKKPAGLANFIDFNLQSSPMGKESAGDVTSGVGAK